MKLFKHLCIVTFVGLICSCIALFAIQQVEIKHQYRVQIISSVDALLNQQHKLLQRLSHQLPVPLHEWGALDVAMYLHDVEVFIRKQISTITPVYDFVLYDIEPIDISIVTNGRAYSWAFAKMLRDWLLVWGALMAILWCVCAMYARHSQQKEALQQVRQENSKLRANLKLHKSAVAVQTRYGNLRAVLAMHTEQQVHVGALLHDVKTVNLELATIRNVTLQFPQQELQLCLQSNHVLLMQVLSGLVHTILQQLSAHSTITATVETSELQAGRHSFVFKLQDNGFYTSFMERQELLSLTDIRANGWHNILDLTTRLGGRLEHTHTAYVGNCISLTIGCKLINNVVQLASYLEDRD